VNVPRLHFTVGPAAEPGSPQLTATNRRAPSRRHLGLSQQTANPPRKEVDGDATTTGP